jgi:DNA repair protein RecO (recombination protein O)
MLLKTKGIVLHTTKYSETSVIAKIYTDKLGLVSYIIKGVRSSKSRNKAALLQPLTLLDMEVNHRENKSLQFIKEFSRAHSYQSLPFDTIKSAIALFLLEVIAKSIHEHEPNEELFDFVYHSLCLLDESVELNPDFHLLFLTHFTRHLGFFPHNNYTETNSGFNLLEGVFVPTTTQIGNILKPEESRIIFELANASFSSNLRLGIGRFERKKTLSNLLRYYQFHIENFNIKSAEVLEEIFA